MLGYYKKTREEIVRDMKKLPYQTEDGNYFYRYFPKINKAKGQKKDKGYKYPRYYFNDKIVFSPEDIEAYLDQGDGKYDWERIIKRNAFVMEAIAMDMDYEIEDKIEGKDFTLGELIDTTIYFFNHKY